MTRIDRVPLGNILIIGPANYPLFLPGVQAIQALAAGNAVLLKPGRRGTPAARALEFALTDAGLPPRLLTVLPEDITSVEAALDAGIAKVFLTGSFATGQRLLELLAPRCIPAVVELSGCDAAILLPDHPHGRFIAALRFGLLLNHGQTCIAPRRAFVPRTALPQIESALRIAFGSAAAQPIDPALHRRMGSLARVTLHQGARLVTSLSEHPDHFGPLVLTNVDANAPIANDDLFAPVLSVIPYDDPAELPALVNGSPYALGASIFGPDSAAETLARQLTAPTVTINDIFAPTADPRLPFSPAPGTRSGFGTTRGAQGLLEMTVPKVTLSRRGGFLPHLDPPSPVDERLFTHLLRATHSKSLVQRVTSAMKLLKTAATRHRRSQPSTE